MDDWDGLWRAEPQAVARVEPLSAGAKAPRGASASTAAWMLAATPVAYSAIVLADAFARKSFESPMLFVVAALSIPIGVLLATVDERRLRAAGYPRTVPAKFGALPPAYLFMRGHRCVSNNHEGFGPAWLHLALVLLALASMTILNPWIRAAIYLVRSANGI